VRSGCHRAAATGLGSGSPPPSFPLARGWRATYEPLDGYRMVGTNGKASNRCRPLTSEFPDLRWSEARLLRSYKADVDVDPTAF
jgi:hypothetical protein